MTRKYDDREIPVERARPETAGDQIPPEAWLSSAGCAITSPGNRILKQRRARVVDLTSFAVESDDDAAWSNYLEIALKSGEIGLPGR